jgi:hypothetical protein
VHIPRILYKNTPVATTLKEDAKVMLENLHFDQEKLRQMGTQIYFGKDTWIDAKEIRPEAKSVTIPGGQETRPSMGRCFTAMVGRQMSCLIMGPAFLPRSLTCRSVFPKPATRHGPGQEIANT